MEGLKLWLIVTGVRQSVYIHTVHIIFGGLTEMEINELIVMNTDWLRKFSNAITNQLQVHV